MTNAVRAELVAGVLDDLTTMREHQHALMFGDRALDDLAKNDRLAAAGRRDDQWPRCGSEELFDLIDNIGLIGAKLDHGALSAAMRSSAAPSGPEARP